MYIKIYQYIIISIFLTINYIINDKFNKKFLEIRINKKNNIIILNYNYYN